MFVKIIGGVIGYVIGMFVRKLTMVCCSSAPTWTERFMLKLGGILLGTWMAKSVKTFWITEGKETKKKLEKEIEEEKKKKKKGKEEA